jgi:tRNA modification GTPase
MQAAVPVAVTSSVTGAGLDEFAAAIAGLLSSTAAGTRAGCVAATAVRCGESLGRAASAVEVAANLAARDAGDELVAAELRAALGELGKVIGAVYTDDLLDRIFKSFCIGK